MIEGSARKPGAEPCGSRHRVWGEEEFARAVEQALNEIVRELRVETTAPRLVVVSHSASGDLERWRKAQEFGQPWLSVLLEVDRVIVGPLSVPGRPGCAGCLMRRLNALSPLPPLLSGGHEKGSSAVSPLLGGLAARSVAAAAAELLVASEGTEPGRHVVSIVHLKELQHDRHVLLPLPDCEICGALPADCRQAARLPTRELIKPDAGMLRTRSLLDLEGDLERTYVDAQMGVIGGPSESGEFAFPLVGVPLGRQRDRVDRGYGRTFDFGGSRLTAIAEGLERLGGLSPRGKRTAVHGCYRNLVDDAIDPRDLGLYSEERYERERLPFQRYHEELELPWVWAYSFAAGAPRLVPECCAYYGKMTPIDAEDPARPFVYEISNGCALGSSLEEALLFGLLELAERDAFLMTWLARLFAPKLDLDSCVDRRVPLMVERIEHRTGYRISIFNTTLEEGIPCFWALALDPSGRDERPRSLSAAGSAMTPEKGIVNALHELNTSIEAHMASYPGRRELAARMVEDPYLVRSMEDHALLYCHPGAAERLDFLPANGRGVPLEEFREQWHWPQHRDLAKDLEQVVGRFKRSGLDVLVVDQTTNEHRAMGFSCAKAIVPGLLPMTFGHHTRRIEGLPRLLQVPRRLGWTTRDLEFSELNPHPHPFP